MGPEDGALLASRALVRAGDPGARAEPAAENGLGHKDVIRFRTPGLNGIAGAAI